jgi:lambda repressor-like predicted transcriptional regulator
MVQTESGGWTWAPFWNEYDALIERHNDLVRRWNKFVPLINDRKPPIGRPLAASEEERDLVLRLRKAGKSLRAIAEEAEVGFSTVRTIIDKANGSDRAEALAEGSSRRDLEGARLRADRPHRQPAAGGPLEAPAPQRQRPA